MMMMEESEMEIESQVFVAHEIDLDYEFDAVRFFDFGAQETPAQARQAELWFHSSPSSSKLLSMASYGGELLLDSSSP